ncbi:MAG: lipid-binding SYLF domain-containing protein [Pyrinomonadaceae bacterium]|nr:lipid-binding SYLF domain-containing protein [Pyrinomonadaceae bacterium]
MRNSRFIFLVFSVVSVVILAALAANSQTKKPKSKAKTTRAAAAPTPTPEPPIRGPNTTEGASQASKSSQVLREIMGTRDKGIPRDLLDKAECVMVFPKVLKAGFIVGGQRGRGVASCRTRSGWSAPAYFEMKGGSVGFQIGGQSTDFVLLIMNESGMKNLLSDRFELGGEASVAAGPVGRTAAASTDAKMDAEILSYSRSRGLFGGVSLKGSVISPDKSDMEGTYGEGMTAELILRTNKSRAPSEVRVFPNALSRYASRTAK